MEQHAVNTLNELLKGEQMAIQSYSLLLKDLKDQEIKDIFQKIQGDHNEHSEMISKRILELGGRPDYSTGMAGLMADAKHGIENIKKRTDHELIMEAFKGEDKGVASAEKIADGNLDEESLKLIHKILDTDHSHIKALEGILNKH